MKKKLLHPLSTLSILTLTAFGFTSVQSTSIGATGSPVVMPHVEAKIKALKASSEAAIQMCEKRYNVVKELGKKLDNIKKPSLFSDQYAKLAYKNKDLYKKVFDHYFREFTAFTNEKIKLRMAYPKLNVHSGGQETESYADKCRQYSDKLSQFAEWAISGEKVHKNLDATFKTWLK